MSRKAITRKRNNEIKRPKNTATKLYRLFSFKKRKTRSPETTKVQYARIPINVFPNGSCIKICPQRFERYVETDHVALLSVKLIKFVTEYPVSVKSTPKISLANGNPARHKAIIILRIFAVFFIDRILDKNIAINRIYYEIQNRKHLHIHSEMEEEV